jgi:Flp pilus assembly protein CpaB
VSTPAAGVLTFPGMRRDHPRHRLLQRLLAGPPPVLPPALDRVAEVWAAAGTRARMILVGVAIFGLAALAGRGAATSPWGGEVGVLVAAADLPAGHRLEPGDLSVAAWPGRLVPPDAPTDPAAVAGRPLSVGLPSGGLVTAAHLAPGGVASGLPVGSVAFPLPLPDGVGLAPGQRLDLVAGDGAGGGSRLASGARVLSVDGAIAWLAVARDEAPALAGAGGWGEVTVAILPPGPTAPP